MVDKDRWYFQQRAEVELERAQAASTPEVVRAHYQLAEAYLDRIAMSADGANTTGGIC